MHSVLHGNQQLVKNQKSDDNHQTLYLVLTIIAMLAQSGEAKKLSQNQVRSVP